MSEKSILEQALLQVQNLEEAVKANAKGILASTMKQELNELLKESEVEEEEVMANHEDAMNPKEEEEKDMSDEESHDDETADDETDLDNDTEDTDSTDSDDMDAETSADDVTEPEFGAGDDDMDSDDSEDVMDMTGASDDEVLKVFKAMKPEDGIVVKKDGNNLHINDGDEEYIVKLDDLDDESEMSEEMPTQEDSMEEDMDETLYEIELNEEEEEETKDEDMAEPKEEALPGLKGAKKVEPKEEALAGLKSPKKVEPKEEALPGLKGAKKVEPKEEALAGLKSPKKVEPKEEVESNEEEVDEAARTQGNDVRGEGPRQGKKYKAGRPELNEEVDTLRKQNDDLKKALVLFKDKLNEVAVFNASLAYATRLFTEHSTTKQEKLNILKRFDSVSSMNESKNLFETIKTELGSKITVTETVVEKISNSQSSSSSTEVLAESKAYENPQFARMKDLMKKIK